MLSAGRCHSTRDASARTGSCLSCYSREQKLLSLQNCICHTGGVHRCLHIVGANDVRAFQDKRRLGCDRAEKAIAGRNLLFTPNGAAYKRFPRSAGQQRESQAVQFLEVSDQRIILIETLAEAE